LSQLDDAGDLHPLDTDSAIPAAISRTWPVMLARYLVSKIVHRVPKDLDESLETEAVDESESGSESPGSGAATPNHEAVLKGGRTATVKAGGKRRKAVRKR
jgi:DnaJ family protein C protein 1